MDKVGARRCRAQRRGAKALGYQDEARLRGLGLGHGAPVPLPHYLGTLHFRHWLDTPFQTCYYLPSQSPSA